jgi:dihydroorotase
MNMDHMFIMRLAALLFGGGIASCLFPGKSRMSHVLFLLLVLAETAVAHATIPDGWWFLLPGAKLHICHVSTEDSVRMIAAAKKEGLDVTAEVTPHHLTLTEDDINEDDANYKVNPPLRTNKDKDMLIKGLKDGTIDIIATDHAPHHLTEKDRGFVEAPFGISGLETAVAIIMTDLVKKNVITPLEMADKMSYTPAKIIGIDKGTLLVGKTADITIIDPDAEYVIDSKTFASRGKNTPFNGKKVSGEIKYTIAGGKIVYSNINGTEVIIDKDVPKL